MEKEDKTKFRILILGLLIGLTIGMFFIYFMFILNIDNSLENNGLMKSNDCILKSYNQTCYNKTTYSDGNIIDLKVICQNKLSSGDE